MERDAFKKALSRRLFPRLRRLGFRGSGATLRRVEGPVVHVFNVQGSSSGAACYLNLGAHLDFLPSDGGGEFQPKKCKEYQCAFRERIDPPAGSGFGWAYVDGPALDDSLALIEEEWRLQAEPFFERYRAYPESFATLLDNAVPVQIHARDARTLALIAIHMGRLAAAQSLAKTGLDTAPPGATLLVADLRRIVEECEGAV